MKQTLSAVGSVVGWSGVLLCLIAGGAKAFGSFYILDYETMTIFTVGIGLIATGCLAKLEGRAN